MGISAAQAINLVLTQTEFRASEQRVTDTKL